MAGPNSAQQEPTMEEILASIRRIISEDSEPAKPQGQAPQPHAASSSREPDVLELTQVVEEQAAQQSRPEPQPERRPEPKARAPKPEPRPEPAPRKASAPPPPKRNELDLDMVDKDEKDDTLVSNQTQSAISAAFNMLARDRDVAVSTGEARTLEDIVAQMLKPMLKEWLEDNLPDIVERVVREEVERASRMTRRR